MDSFVIPGLFVINMVLKVVEADGAYAIKKYNPIIYVGHFVVLNDASSIAVNILTYQTAKIRKA